jgi:hypothetical protein
MKQIVHRILLYHRSEWRLLLNISVRGKSCNNPLFKRKNIIDMYEEKIRLLDFQCFHIIFWIWLISSSPSGMVNRSKSASLHPIRRPKSYDIERNKENFSQKTAKSLRQESYIDN